MKWQTVMLGLAVVGSSMALASEPINQLAPPQMATHSNKMIGIAFNRPSHWILNDKQLTGRNEVAFIEWPTAEKVRPEMRVTREDSKGGLFRIDVDSPPPPKAVTSRVLRVDGVPARLIVHKCPPDGKSELLFVQIANGSRFYTLSMIFASESHDKYMALADAVCTSIRLLPANQP